MESWTPIAPYLKSACKCPEHKATSLRYWKVAKNQYTHYFCSKGDHWLNIPLDSRDEVK